MAEEMLAARLDRTSGGFALKRIPVPEPGRGQVRVKVKAAGVCASDVHLIAGVVKPPNVQDGEVTLGHETAGVIDKVGPGVFALGAVGGVGVGTRVVIIGGKAIFGQVLALGSDFDGGWAEYIVVPVEMVVPIPDSLPYEQAAIIPDAVSTPWGAVSSTANVRAAEAVGVWGAGGLGVHAIQLLRLVGAAPIVAVDPSPAARTRALAFGADLALDPGQPDLAERILGVTDRLALAAAFDFSGTAAARAQALANVAVGGRLVLVGLSGDAITIPNGDELLYTRRAVLGHFGYDEHHLAQLIRLAKLGRLDLSASITRTYPLAEAAQAVHDLEHKVGDPVRLVLIP